MIAVRVIAPDLPHNIEGRIFHSDGVTGVENGIPVRINDTVNGETVLVYTYAPDVPELKGAYSGTITGSDGDKIVIVSWNTTYYGNKSSALATTTTTVDVILDTVKPGEPNVTIIAPPNNSIRNTSISFNVTANITIIGGKDALNCNATISFSDASIVNISKEENLTITLGSLSLGSSALAIWNLTGNKDGNGNITVSAGCDSNYYDFDGVHTATINITIQDTTPPVVNLEFPFNNTWINIVNITFRYNAIDPGNIKNCSLYIDNVLNKTNTTVAKDISQNFTVDNIAEGNHTWFVSCYDNSSIYNQGNSSLGNFSADGTMPFVSLINPENPTTTPNNTILFQYNVTDNFDVMNCSLILNDARVQTNASITKNVTLNFSLTILGGEYRWQVNCTDQANNIASSVINFLTINDPDLQINSSDIIFSTDAPIENQNITINATVHNIGTENATNVTVQFFENDPDINGIQISGNITVNISINGTANLSISYAPRVGSLGIYVIVDPPLATNGIILESNENNNKANKTLTVSAYHIYYGEIDARVLLETSSNLTVYTWFNESNIAGNILVADTDSSISWNNLQALSRNLSNNLTFDDFAELDIALNLTNLADSINNTYTLNSEPLAMENFTVLGLQITNVPVVNSTNSSDFVTGILWDTSDENKGNFNATQDVLFVTKINPNKQGKYGIVDYEIKVPAELRRYIKPNSLNTITFYVELR